MATDITVRDAGVSALNLRAKLAGIRKQIHNVEKRGKNQFHHYDYATASDIAGLLGTALADANIILARRGLTVARSFVDKGSEKAPETVVEISLDYGFLDGDSDEQIWQPAYGEGRDTGDKAAYKAFTGALKYFLVQTFLLAMGDDPEDDSTDEHLEHANGHRAETQAPQQGKRVCPKCGVAAITKGKAEFGGGWFCWKKQGGCGATFTDEDLEHPAQPARQGGVETPAAHATGGGRSTQRTANLGDAGFHVSESKQQPADKITEAQWTALYNNGLRVWGRGHSDASPEDRQIVRDRTELWFRARFKDLDIKGWKGLTIEMSKELTAKLIEMDANPEPEHVEGDIEF